MPPSASSASKRHRLTLAQLSAYDDILTDALVDHVFYWTTVPKNRSSYHPSRGVREDEIGKILQEEVVLNKDLVAAEQRLLKTDGLRRFHNGLRTAQEREDFRRHLRRYVQIYSPDCPWEVNSTNRYTIVSHEAAVTARRLIKRNESIKYLSGIQVNITPEEENEMAARRKDFSIVVSSRSKCASLFMGPARFANHDCEANAKLMTTGQSGIEIIATQKIEPGEEITVTYGDNYFGEDNCECLCMTCEAGQRNAWEPPEGVEAVKVSIEEEKPAGYALRRRRRDHSLGGSSQRSSVTPDIRPRIRKSASKSAMFGSSTANSPARQSSPRGTKRPHDALATPPKTPAKRMKHLVEMSHQESFSSSRASSVTGSESSSSGDMVETDVTSPEKESPEPPFQTPAKQKAHPPSHGDIDQSAVGTVSHALPVSPESTEGARSPLSIVTRDASTEAAPAPTRSIATMSITAILNSPAKSEPGSKFDAAPEEAATEAAVPKKTAPERASPEPKPRVAATIENEPSEESQSAGCEQEEAPKRRKYQRRVFIKQNTPPARVRTPRDYHLTPLLLSEPEMAWIQCTICDTHFVQQNAYVTKSSCPRCERHSKLYGYVWPKTDKEGPRDKEERILDHRTIHRFLDPDDERRARGRRSLLAAKAESEDTDEQDEPARGRRLKRGNGKGSATNAKSGIEAKEEEDTSIRRSGRFRRVSNKLVG